VPLIAQKSDAQRKMLAVGTTGVKCEFRRRQRVVKKAVDKAGQDWIRRVAMEGEAAKKNGRTRWNSTRRLQQARSGRRQARRSSMRKDNISLTQGPHGVCDRWHQHFSELANQRRGFDREMIQQLESLSPSLDLDPQRKS